MEGQDLHPVPLEPVRIDITGTELEPIVATAIGVGTRIHLGDDLVVALPRQARPSAADPVHVEADRIGERVGVGRPPPPLGGGLEPREQHSATEGGALPRVRADDQGRLRGAGIRRSQRQRLSQEERALPHRDDARLLTTRRLEVPRPLQRRGEGREGGVDRARSLVASLRGDVDGVSGQIHLGDDG